MAEEKEESLACVGISRDVNGLLDPNFGVRKAALCRIEQRLKSAQDLQELSEDGVIKALLRRFDDPSERCRCLAVSIVLGLLQVIPSSIIALLPYILPVISERLPLKSLPEDEEPLSKAGQETMLVEPSEEVRLLLVQLLHSILNQAPRLIHPFASDIASIIMVSASDTHPEVLMETMALLERFAGIMDHKIKPIAKQLVSVVLRSLLHNRYKVRVAALRAIHRLVLCGAHESIYDLTAFQDPNLIPIRAFYHPYVKTQYLAVLATDKTTAVRKELLQTVASWLLKLDERKQHEVRLLPYVVSALNDSDSSIQELAFQLIEEIGQQYEKENETEVKDVKNYLQEAIEDVSLAGKRLPPAFKHRPCLGSRILVRSCFSVLLHAIDADLGAWTSGTKALSANFLYTMLIFVEENVTMHLEPLCALLIKACSDPLIEKEILECAKLVGFFVDPSAYLAIMLPHITGEVSGDVTVQQAGRTLKILSALMSGSPPNLITKYVPDICSTLTDQDLITSIDWDVNQGIVLSCKCMVAAWNEECRETLALLWLILNAIAAAEFCGKSSLNAESVLKYLAKASKYTSSEELLASYVEDVLSMLPHPQFWIMRSLQPLVYCRLIKAGSAAQPDSVDKLFFLLRFCGESSIDENIKSRLLLAVEDLVERSADDSPGLQLHVSALLEGFVVPCLSHGDPLLTPTLRVVRALTSKPWASSAVTSNLLQAAISSNKSLIKSKELISSKNRHDAVNLHKGDVEYASDQAYAQHGICRNH